MNALKILGATAAVIAAVTTSSASFAGPGPCTSGGGYAVGVDGPAMNGGQRMAGVGNCRYGHWRNSNAYYDGPRYETRYRTYGYERPYGYDRDYGYYDRGYGYGYYDRGYGPGVSIGVEGW